MIATICCKLYSKTPVTSSKECSQLTSRAAAQECACSSSSYSQERSNIPEADASPRFKVNSATQEGPLTCCTATDCLLDTCKSAAVQEGSWRRACSSGATSWCKRPSAQPYSTWLHLDYMQQCKLLLECIKASMSVMLNITSDIQHHF